MIDTIHKIEMALMDTIYIVVAECMDTDNIILVLKN